MIFPVPKPTKVKKEKRRWIPRKKDTGLAKMIEKADDVCSDLVKLRAGYKCQGLKPLDGSRCNRSPIHPHHIVGRRKSLFTRFLPANNVGLCDICHDHDNKQEMDDMVIKLIGEQEWDRLHKLSLSQDFGGMTKLEFVQSEYNRLNDERKRITK